MSDPSAAIGSGDRTVTLEDVFGLWSVTPVTGDGSCRLALSREPRGAVLGLLAENCTLPPFETARGWRLVPGGFEILTAWAGEAVRFAPYAEDEFRSADGGFRLSRAPTV